MSAIDSTSAILTIVTTLFGLIAAYFGKQFASASSDAGKASGKLVAVDHVIQDIDKLVTDGQADLAKGSISTADVQAILADVSKIKTDLSQIIHA